MPQTNCLQCGAPYETQPDLTTDSMRSSLRRSRYMAGLSSITALIAIVLVWIIWPSPTNKVSYEATGPGVVRYFEPQRHMLLHESDGGYMKMLEPVCGTPGVWAHMRVNIRFHWSEVLMHWDRTAYANSEGCYQIENIQRIGPDAQ